MVSLSKDKEKVDQEVKDFMYSLVESVTDEMHYYFFETMGAEYDPTIRKNQAKIKALETRINNLKHTMKDIENDKDFQEFLTYHSKFFMLACMFSFGTGLPLAHSVYLFEEDGSITLEGDDDY